VIFLSGIISTDRVTKIKPAKEQQQHQQYEQRAKSNNFIYGELIGIHHGGTFSGTKGSLGRSWTPVSVSVSVSVSDFVSVWADGYCCHFGDALFGLVCGKSYLECVC